MSLLYSKVKIVGTVLCVAGAVTMSLMHNAAGKGSHVSMALDTVFDKQKIIGSSYLLAAVFLLSSIVVLQVTRIWHKPIDSMLYSNANLCVFHSSVWHSTGCNLGQLSSTDITLSNNFIDWRVYNSCCSVDQWRHIGD